MDGARSGGNAARLRVLLVAERYQLAREHVAFHEALARRFSLRTWFVDDGPVGRVADLPEGVAADADAVLVFVSFRTLEVMPTIDWAGCAAVRAAYDLDVYANRSQVISDRWLGRFPSQFRRHAFDVVVCSGSEAAEDMCAHGLTVAWVPKGVDAQRFSDLGGPRHGACHYGTAYRARRAALRRLERAGVPVTPVRAPFDELNAALNGFLACVISNQEARVWPGPLRHLDRLDARLGANFGRGPEVMAKNFESAAAGCAPVCDVVADLDALGFVDGETAVTWHDHDELIEKLRHWFARPNDLRAIGRRATALVAARHTLDHRAAEIEAVLRSHAAAASL